MTNLRKKLKAPRHHNPTIRPKKEPKLQDLSILITMDYNKSTGRQMPHI